MEASTSSRRGLEVLTEEVSRLIGPASRGDQDARNELVQACLPVLRSMVRKLNRPELQDDLIQAGHVGLLKGLEKYQAEKATEGGELAYLLKYMQGAVLKAVKKEPRTTPLDAAVGEGDIPALLDTLAADGPTPEELAAAGRSEPRPPAAPAAEGVDSAVVEIDDLIAFKRQLVRRNYVLEYLDVRQDLATLKKHLHAAEVFKAIAAKQFFQAEAQGQAEEAAKFLTEVQACQGRIEAAAVGLRGAIDRRASLPVRRKAAVAKVNRQGGAKKGSLGIKKKAADLRQRAVDLNRDPTG